MTASNTYGRQVIDVKVNKSGGGVVKGDVLIPDAANDNAFTTTTSAAAVSPVWIAQETIASNASGRVLLEGFADLVNVNAAVTRGHYGQTHTVAKQAADAGLSRQAGTFCQFETGGTTPTAQIWATDLGGGTGLAGGTPALTLSTTNSAGVASSGVRTDATIAAFDVTVPAAIGTAAAGAAGTAARRDHVHPLSYVTADATADAAMAADTQTDATGCSVSLAAGTWLIMGDMDIAMAGATYVLLTISDSTNVTQGGSKGFGANQQTFHLHTHAVVSPGSTTTYKLRGQSGNGTIKKLADTGMIATRITAIRLA